MAGSQRETAWGRRGFGVVAGLTPLPSPKKAGEVQASFWGLSGGMPFPSQ